ncbi:alpha-amlyase [Mesobacillus campisalis]|uniref:alpha-amylase n=1 Tax=Mesobacillus campisalis TaxID=1408103 RepID=A0A0M2SRY7_9BACI|nr:alpha-amylase family glycosyl hydrolase [Mesobacillus campisalis]KKK36451.1 alpha-amlyase [Mesobacillus campisalis]
MKKALLGFTLIFILISFSLPAGAVEKEERKWQDETIYFLMIDRFNNGDNSNDYKVDVKDPKAYHGGDFEGITKQLDYIKDMGFTAIWLTPVFDNIDKGYHGYWINDFYATEEHFGTMEEFKRLVQEAHKRDIKIILDFVVNHVAPGHPWLEGPDKKDWFHQEKEITNWNSQEDLENGWLYGLPDLDQDNPDVRKYLLDAAKWWIEETDIDGYRLDTVRHVPVDFWNDFSREVKSVKEDFYLIGEVWSNDPNYIAQYDKAGIDGFVDYPLNDHLRTAFSQPDQTLDWLFSTAKRNESIYEDPYLMGTFLDNHDTVRFTRDIIQNNHHPGPRWRLALTYLYTSPGIPIVYYGSEIALDGGEDPDNRRQMNFLTDKELIDYISRIGEIRGKLPSLTRGTFDVLHEEDGMAVYKREYQDEVSVIAINNSSQTQSVTIPTDQLEDGKELQGLLLNDLVRSEDGHYTVILDREEAEIYRLSDRTGLNMGFLAAILAVIGGFLLFLFVLSRRGKK